MSLITRSFKSVVVTTIDPTTGNREYIENENKTTPHIEYAHHFTVYPTDESLGPTKCSAQSLADAFIENNPQHSTPKVLLVTTTINVESTEEELK